MITAVKCKYVNACEYIWKTTGGGLSRKTSPQLFGGLGANTGLQPHILKLICDVCDTLCVLKMRNFWYPTSEKYYGSGMKQSFCMFMKDNRKLSSLILAANSCQWIWYWSDVTSNYYYGLLIWCKICMSCVELDNLHELRWSVWVSLTL